MMVTGEQIRQARALLGWSQRMLAEAAGYELAVISDFEAGRRALFPEACAAIQAPLEAAGVIFPEGNPPRLKPVP